MPADPPKKKPFFLEREIQVEEGEVSPDFFLMRSTLIDFNLLTVHSIPDLWIHFSTSEMRGMETYFGTPITLDLSRMRPMDRDKITAFAPFQGVNGS